MDYNNLLSMFWWFISSVFFIFFIYFLLFFNSRYISNAEQAKEETSQLQCIEEATDKARHRL